jgi:putative RNA 2'-phosphotransferase
MSITEISKIISHALRHAPSEYGLVLDSEGFVESDHLFEVLSLKGHEVDVKTIQQILDASPKKRFEIIGTKIRALYGHSVQTIQYKKVLDKFPKHLYHATDRSILDLLLQVGLKPMGRQYVHLSSDLQLAKEAAKRKSKDIIVFEVNIPKALDGGIEFYNPSENIWLVDILPAQYLTFSEYS